ncbi:hypothetical protein VTN77DRAFT_1941 [Rasamsonia byssochlamydoides]|uniref:uncharacterized protein n=1 Tax=Rasamsonia byssochlamydoides TaxID=89139 RepID=UPI0037443521
MDYIEQAAAWLLSSRKGHDAGLFHKSRAFANIPEPTIPLESPDIGPTGSNIPPEYGFFGKGLFPTLKWPSSSSAEIKEYLLVVEDPDAPLSQPVVHGLYYSIPASRTSVTNEDFEELSPSEAAPTYTLKGGFKYGLNRRKTVYIPPRGLLGHGPHRYFYQLVALREPIDVSKLSPAATKEEVIEQIDGKVVGWGQWIGVWERKK